MLQSNVKYSETEIKPELHADEFPYYLVKPVKDKDYLYPIHSKGWGRIFEDDPEQSDTLQQLHMPIMKENPKAEQILAGYGQTGFLNQNPCKGDSGGPLMCQRSDKEWIMKGVMSFTGNECAVFTAFTRVARYLSWIKTYVPNVLV